MPFSVPVRALARWSLLMPSLLAVALAQTPPPAPTPSPAPPVSPAAAPRPDIEVAIAAAERWLAETNGKHEPSEALVASFAVDHAAAFAWLQGQLPTADLEPKLVRSQRVHALVTMVALDHVAHRRATDMVYVGQYDLLLRLQPFVGERFFDLLLDTPPWFAFTRRIHLVGPLRDLQPRAPRAERLDAVIRLVENAQVEPEELRRALAATLWQWGTKQYAEAVVAELQQAISDGDAEERVRTTLVLADYYTVLRDYQKAATTHRAAQALAKSTKVPLAPIAWYAAACVHALAGDAERGLQAIERCADLLASPDLDRSLRVPRKSFDDDPELASLRTDPRFAAAMARAFPPAAEPERKER